MQLKSALQLINEHGKELDSRYREGLRNRLRAAWAQAHTSNRNVFLPMKIGETDLRFDIRKNLHKRRKPLRINVVYPEKDIEEKIYGDQREVRMGSPEKGRVEPELA